jgi:thiamine-phosphate pyrophosphorylase
MLQLQPVKQRDWSLCVITDHATSQGRAVVEVVRAAIAGGATMIQLREKEATTRAMVELGHILHDITQMAGVPLIVNDRIDVALAIRAAGVHVGQDDMPAVRARQLIGPDKLLGVSAETPAQAQQAERDGADYLGVGPVYATPSKSDATAPIGLDGLRAAVQSTTLPVLAIGGITSDNAAATFQAGAAGVAVISAVVGAADPEAAARALRSVNA